MGSGFSEFWSKMVPMAKVSLVRWFSGSEKAKISSCVVVVLVGSKMRLDTRYPLAREGVRMKKKSSADELKGSPMFSASCHCERLPLALKMS